MKKLLLIGAGHAHVEVLRQFSEHPAANAAITMVSPQRLMTYAGMLPGLVAGHYSGSQCQVDLASLAKKAGIDLVTDRIVNLHLDGRMAMSASERLLEFDLVSLDIGATSIAPEVPGLRQFALLGKPFEVFLEGWERVCELAGSGALARLTLVGGDPASVELMLAMQHRLKRELSSAAFAAFGFSIVTAAARLVETLPERIGVALESLCTARGISLLRGAAVIAVERDALLLSNGARLASDITVWASGAYPARWLAATGLACDPHGFMQVDASLCSVSHKRVYGAGDCTTSSAHSRPRLGVGALPQGPHLAANLRQALAGRPSLPWTAPVEGWAMISLGSRQAFAPHGESMRNTPPWLNWRLKDWSDRRWVRRFRVRE